MRDNLVVIGVSVWRTMHTESVAGSREINVALWVRHQAVATESFALRWAPKQPARFLLAAIVSLVDVPPPSLPLVTSTALATYSSS